MNITIKENIGNISVMNEQMLNSKRYEESLKRMQEPVLPSQLPKVKMNLAGLSRYTKEKGVSLRELTDQEISRFIPM